MTEHLRLLAKQLTHLKQMRKYLGARYKIYNQPQDRLKQPLFNLAFSIRATLRLKLSWTHYSNILEHDRHQSRKSQQVLPHLRQTP